MRAGTRAILWVLLLLLPPTGCMVSRKIVSLPTDESLVRDQLVIYSDFRLPQHHRLVEDLVARRHDVVDRLRLPVSDEPIYVYLFDSPQRYQSFMAQQYPELPSRRAFFLEGDTRLTVFAHWGDRVAEDLRHEVTHGYLHTMVPHLPVWIDEGLAEYFEVPRGDRGLNRPHSQLLIQATEQQQWAPNLVRLEQLKTPDEMDQRDYAEAWAWMHWMLESSPQRLEILRSYLAQMRCNGSAQPLSDALYAVDPQYQQSLVDHLLRLRES